MVWRQGEGLPVVRLNTAVLAALHCYGSSVCNARHADMVAAAVPRRRQGIATVVEVATDGPNAAEPGFAPQVAKQIGADGLLNLGQ